MDNQIENSKYWQERKLDDKRLDWREGEKNWLDGYWQSQKHLHRNLILKELKKLKWESLLEVGCNCGPNLALIKKNFPEKRLAGIDINKFAIEKAKENLSEINFTCGQAQRLPYANKSFDILLTDAVLIYIAPEEIIKTLKEFQRVAKKALILIEWYQKDNLLGKIKYYHWCRDYEKLCKSLFHCKVEKKKITSKIWPSKNWANVGYLFIVHLQ